MINFGRPWTPSSNQPKHNYFVILTFLTNIQNIRQYPYMYGQRQEIPISFLETHPSQLTMEEMWTNVNFCCLSQIYPFEAIIFLTKAWHQQFALMCIIYVCNVISLVKDAQRMSFVGVWPYTIFFVYEIGVTSKVQKNRNKDPIVKLRSFGHNSFKYWAYFLSPCPCAIICVRVIGNCASP